MENLNILEPNTKEELNLGDLQIIEIKGLEVLINLHYLYLRNNQITEIKGLNTLINLQKLSLGNNQITEIKGLASLTNLQELYLYRNQITEIKGLDMLINLQLLDLSNNQITEIKGLDMLAKLQVLNLENNQIIELKGFDTLFNLQRLYLRKNRITYTNINYLTLQFPPELYICLTNDYIDAAPRLIKGREICLKAKLLLDKIMIVNTIKWWYRNHHLMKPRHPYYIRWMNATIKQFNEEMCGI